jgi:hypothetical protein
MRQDERDILRPALVENIGYALVLRDHGMAFVDEEIDRLFVAIAAEAALLGCGQHLGDEEAPKEFCTLVTELAARVVDDDEGAPVQGFPDAERGRGGEQHGAQEIMIEQQSKPLQNLLPPRFDILGEKFVFEKFCRSGSSRLM